MLTSNETKNQHFISQAEQRLNASDAAQSRIFYFERAAKGTAALRRPKDIAIRRSSSFEDLFSFDVNGTMRTNLEAEFKNYEDNIGEYTGRLLQKLSVGDEDIKADVLEIFAAKFLGLFRNPHAVRKALNSVGPALDTLSDPAGLDVLLQGNRPQQRAVCERYQLSENEYLRWLRSLVLLLERPEPDHPNRFELVIKGLFESHFTQILVCDYSAAAGADACLLSDRGFTVPTESDSMLCFEFNLSATAFMGVAFCDIAASAPPWASHDLVMAARSEFVAHVNVRRERDHLGLLRAYNSRVVFQCAERVFSASAKEPDLEQLAVAP